MQYYWKNNQKDKSFNINPAILLIVAIPPLMREFIYFFERIYNKQNCL